MATSVRLIPTGPAVVPKPSGAVPSGSSPVGSSPVGSSPAGSSPNGSTPNGSTPNGSAASGSASATPSPAWNAAGRSTWSGVAVAFGALCAAALI